MEIAGNARSQTEIRRRRNKRLAAGILTVLGVAITLVFWRTSLPSRPGRSLVVYRDSPYQNTRPGVRYVGDAVCVRCHAEIGESYRLHPMGRSLSPITPDDAPRVENAAGAPLFEAGGLQYSVENRGGHVMHVETRRAPSGGIVAQSEAEVKFTVGSGRQAVGYLVERDGFVFQSPITRYIRPERWDLSPSFEKRNFHFERPIDANCLYCHSNHVENLAGTLNRYERPIFQGYAIGCERCHGPGELHIQRPTMVDGRDLTIVNPAALTPGLRDAVCEQCHLSGVRRIERLDRRNEDFRPGLPFQDFWIALSAGGTAENRFVNQVEQMHESRCFRASQGRLGCISCHDPHRLPKKGEQAAYFRQRCLECHESPGCSLPKETRLARSLDDCVRCHMPRSPSADVAHGSITDHRIVRSPDSAAGPPSVDRQAAEGEGRMLLFHRALMNEQDRTAAGREVGVALARSPQWPESAADAMPLLEAAVLARPDDATAWECKGVALSRLGRYDEAMAAFRTALAAGPNRESTLAAAAAGAVQAGRNDDAIAYWRRVIAINPWQAEYHGRLAFTFFQAHVWGEAAKESREMLRLSPADLNARQLLIKCELRLRDHEAALKEFKTLLKFDLPNRDQLIRQFPTLSRPSREALNGWLTIMASIISSSHVPASRIGPHPIVRANYNGGFIPSGAGGSGSIGTQG